MFLKRLEIQNFQCHHSLDIDFSSGVNTVVGKSGQGKSAVIRAWKWLVFNQPLGEEYRTWNSKETSVKAFLSNGNTIERIRTSKDNIYKLNGQEFRAFGQSPPEPVQKALNLGPINFQFQHDPLYLLAMRPPEVARVLNELAKLDKIDSSFSFINSRLRKENQEAASQESIKNRLEEDLEKYSGLEELEVKVSISETLAERIESTQRSKAKLSALASNLAIFDDQIEKMLPSVEMKRSLDRLEGRRQETSIKKKKLGELIRLSEKLNQIESKDLKWSKALVKMRKDLASEEIEDSCTRIAYNIQAIELVTDRTNRLKKLNQEIDKTKEEADSCWKKFNEMMPEECPLCGNKGGKRK